MVQSCHRAYIPGMNMQTVRDFAERRQAPRFFAALPVELEGGTGITRDISRFGVLFETNVSSSVGAPISFNLLLEHVDPGGLLRLNCHGQIVRVERDRGKLCVAAAITSYGLEPIRPPAGPEAGG